MQPHQERVVAEKAELDGRRERLIAFIGGGYGEVYRTLDAAEQMRLNRQLEAMSCYSTILEDRINAFGYNRMKKGTRVSWLATGATVRGHGVVISDEENGSVLVSVDGGTFENIPTAYHLVIRCTVTWLTPE